MKYTDTALAEQFNKKVAERPVPKPGLHRGVAMRDYHTWNAVGNSWLSRLKKSPAHLRAYLEEPPPDTADLLLGRAVHAAVLEPDDFEKRYAGAPDGLDRRTKSGKQQWDDLLNEYGDGCVLKSDDHARCLAMRDAVWRKTSTKVLLSTAGESELSAVWRGSGVLCKARADRLTTEIAGGTIIDLKTTGDASIREFERSLFKFGYYRQAAHYLAGFQAVGVDVAHFAIIAVEKTPPFECAVYRIVEAAIDAGAEENRVLLAQYAQCVERGEWPGYPDRVEPITLPSWAWTRIEEDREI